MHHIIIRSGHRMYHLLDTPGARSLVSKTIMGIAQADAALLIIDGSNTESFDEGMDGGVFIEAPRARDARGGRGPRAMELRLQLGGQTKEHALIA